MERAKKEGTEKRVLPLKENLFYRISFLHFRLSKAAEKIYKVERLNSHQWKILGVLNNFGPLRSTEIKQYVTFDKAAISRAIKQLTKLSLVKRKQQRDARSYEMALTNHGMQVYGRIGRRIYKLQERLFPDEDARAATFQFILNIEKRLRT